MLGAFKESQNNRNTKASGAIKRASAIDGKGILASIKLGLKLSVVCHKVMSIICCMCWCKVPYAQLEEKHHSHSSYVHARDAPSSSNEGDTVQAEEAESRKT